MTTPANLFELFVAMGRSEFKFHLTGSRYFDCARPDSDWDFFVSEHDSLEARLQDWGFSTLSLIDGDYGDSVTMAVYNHPLGVDVQIIHLENIGAKLRARAALRELGVWTGDKSVMRDIWSALLQEDGTLFGLTNPRAIDLFLQSGYPAFFYLPLKNK